jgi:hypothetical protein
MVRPMKFRQWSVKRGMNHVNRKCEYYEASIHRKKRPLDQLAFLKNGSIVTRKDAVRVSKIVKKVEYEIGVPSLKDIAETSTDIFKFVRERNSPSLWWKLF